MGVFSTLQGISSRHSECPLIDKKKPRMPKKYDTVNLDPKKCQELRGWTKRSFSAGLSCSPPTKIFPGWIPAQGFIPERTSKASTFHQRHGKFPVIDLESRWFRLSRITHKHINQLSFIFNSAFLCQSHQGSFIFNSNALWKSESPNDMKGPTCPFKKQAGSAMKIDFQSEFWLKSRWKKK